jgi:hypothetical protein
MRTAQPVMVQRLHHRHSPRLVELAMNETIRMVVAVKAYPVLSTKYHEAVCIAGVRTDSLFEARWVRLFPVQFRDLPQEKQFDKWDEIEVTASKHSGDSRPESYRPNVETIRVLGRLSTTQNWKARRAVSRWPARDRRRWSARGTVNPCGADLGVLAVVPMAEDLLVESSNHLLEPEVHPRQRSRLRSRTVAS